MGILARRAVASSRGVGCELGIAALRSSVVVAARDEQAFFCRVAHQWPRRNRRQASITAAESTARTSRRERSDERWERERKSACSRAVGDQLAGCRWSDPRSIVPDAQQRAGKIRARRKPCRTGHGRGVDGSGRQWAEQTNIGDRYCCPLRLVSRVSRLVSRLLSLSPPRALAGGRAGRRRNANIKTNGEAGARQRSGTVQLHSPVGGQRTMHRLPPYPGEGCALR